MSSATTISSYEQAISQHRWEVPERYNIAADVCDRHPREKPAMIHEDFHGNVREVSWGDLQDASNRFANVLVAHGVEPGDRVAMLLPPTPETAAAFFGTWKTGAILLSMSVLYGDEGIRHRLTDSQPKVLVTNEANADRMERSLVEHVLILDDELLSHGSTSFNVVDTAADDPAQLYYSSGTTGLAKGILHAHRYILGHEEFIYCHDVRDGELFHGMGEWAWAAGICPLIGPWRIGAVQTVYQREGGFDPRKQLAFLVQARRHQRVCHPDRDPLDDVDQRRGHPLPAEVPDRVLGRRAAEPRGDPLVPRSVRRHRARLLRAHRVLPAVRELPVHGGARGLDGQADAGLGGGDPRRGRAAGRPRRAGRDLPQGALQPALPAGVLEPPRRTRKEVFGGDWFHTKDAASADDDGYYWYEGRADDVIISAGYRIGPFEVESACLEHPAVAEAAVVASPDERRGHVVKAFVVLAAGQEPSDALADEIKAYVREHHSAYSYPRRVEFVDDLPKTLTGKIRRIELRQREQQSGPA